MERPFRVRRSCLAVPASNQRFIDKARDLPVDELFLDLEDAGGLAAVNAIAAASPRLEALVFGPADVMASVGIRSLDVGGQPEGYADGGLG